MTAHPASVHGPRNEAGGEPLAAPIEEEQRAILDAARSFLLERVATGEWEMQPLEEGEAWGYWLGDGQLRVAVVQRTDLPDVQRQLRDADAVLSICPGESEPPQPSLDLPEGDELTSPQRVVGRPFSLELLAAHFEALVDHCRLCRARNSSSRLLRLSLTLNSEKEPSAIANCMLREARGIIGADAGSIYLVDDGHGVATLGGRLRFFCAQNDSVSLDFRSFELAINDDSIAGSCALHGVASRLADARGTSADRRSEGEHDGSFDARSGYQTVSMLSVPMRAQDGGVIGVMQLINARRGSSPLLRPEDFEARIRAFDAEDESLCMTIAAQGAVAMQNARLYHEAEASLRGFVEASVMAIEARDPTTSGHSRRVAELCMTLGEACYGVLHPELGRLGFSREQLEELEYAALLHDFGKVSVPDGVLTKAKKLRDGRLDLLAERLRHMKNCVRSGGELTRLGTGGPESVGDSARAIGLLERAWDLVTAANEPTLLKAAVSEELRWVASLELLAGDGQPLRLLDPADLEALRVERGSLTASERKAIQAHVVCSREFLSRIPWRRNLACVPEIAGKHHEYLDGSGYPEGVSAADIPAQSRIMTICDIYDALTATDRPYKRAASSERALEIIGREAERNRVDPTFFSIFRARIRSAV